MLARPAISALLCRRPARVVAAAAGVAVLAGVLTSCDKPLPELSVLAGSTVVRVQPQTYFFNGPASTRIQSASVAQIKAAAGSSILVDVPREVAGKQWQVSAITLDSAGKQAAVAVDGASSPIVQNTHSTRVFVPYGSGTYYLKVQAQGGTAGGVWLVEVNVTS
jgi:hypothetical protein